MRRGLEERLNDIKKDDNNLNDLIKDYEPFILASASEFSKRHISRSDDEWSIALIAFYEAVETFDADRGSFFAYAKLIIKSRLIDYFRSQEKHSGQISVEQLSETDLPAEEKDTDVHYEIDALGQTLARYGFSFTELADCSPKAQKTRESCKKAVRYLLANPILIEDMRLTRLLPLKILAKNTQVPRKILERHRKYIITAAEVLSGDYPGLGEYMAYIKKEE